MNSKVFILIVLYIFVSNVLSNEFDSPESNEDWIDFGDMFSYDTHTKTNIKDDKINPEKDESKQQCVCPPSEPQNTKLESNCDQFLDKLDVCNKDKEILKQSTKSSTCNQRIVTFVNRAVLKLIIKLNAFERQMSVEENIWISTYIHPKSVKTIEEFMNQTKIECKRVDEFEDIIYEVINQIYFDHSKNQSLIYRFIENNWFKITISLALIFVSIFLYKFYFMAIWAKCVAIYSLVLISSFVWQWIQLYQKALAARQMTLSKTPNECVYMKNEDQLTITSVFTSFIKSFTSLDKKCEDYYRALMVDPIFEINPLVAISSTLSEALFAPISIFGDQLGKGLSNFYVYFNFYEKFFITSLLTIIMGFALILYMGYSIRLPFLLGSIIKGPPIPPIRHRMDSNSLRSFDSQFIHSIQSDSERSRAQGRRALESNEQNINFVSHTRPSLRRWQSTTSLARF